MKGTNLDTIPFIDLPEQFRALAPQIRAAMDKIFDDASFIQGPPVREFESAFARFCRARHCVAVHSGTAALHLALLACGVKPGDHVITAPNSFIATAEAIAFCGAVPRFVDVSPVSYNLDAAQLEHAITPRTTAIIPVHLYGQPADMDPILSIAARRGIPVIEDACQAHGATYKGRPVGTIGSVGCFSFYPGKNLGAAGDGGAIVTDNATIADKIAMMRDHGSHRKYEHDVLGHNFRLDSIQCAILSLKLPHLDNWNEKRKDRARYYTERLQDVAGVAPPVVATDRQSVFHLYAIRVSDRAHLEKQLHANKIQYGIHYPTPIHLQGAFAALNLKEGSFPVSEQLSKEVLSLPIFPALTESQQDRVIETIRLASKNLPPLATLGNT